MMAQESAESVLSEEVEQIVLTNQARLRAFLFCRVGHTEVADDLAQEVFLVFLKRLDDYDRSQPVWPWLVGIARNKLREYWRAREKEKTTHAIDLYLAKEQLRRDEETAEALYTEEKLEALRGCISKLPRKSRQLLDFAYVKRLASAEIAKHWDVTAGAIRIALYRIRTALSTCVKSVLEGSST